MTPEIGLCYLHNGNRVRVFGLNSNTKTVRIDHTDAQPWDLPIEKDVRFAGPDVPWSELSNIP